jgi:hypothetical protein
MTRKKGQLDAIGTPGFYSDLGGTLYVDMAEFLAAHGLPETEAARAAVWQEIYRVFGAIEIIEL